MWFIVKTDVFSEQQSIDFLREKYNHIITDFYFPLGRKTYKNENGEVKVRLVPYYRECSSSECKMKGV